MPSERPSEKPRVEQIDDRTGLSRDYVNEYMWAFTIARSPALRKTFLQRAKQRQAREGKLVQTYIGRFAKKGYGHLEELETDQTREPIRQLDQWAEDMNQALDSDPPLTVERFLDTARQVAALIYGGTVPPEFQ